MREQAEYRTVQEEISGWMLEIESQTEYATAMSINVEEVEKAETPCPKTSCRSVQFQTPRLVRSDEMPLEKVQCTSSTSVTPCRVTSRGASARRLSSAFKSPLRIVSDKQVPQSTVEIDNTLKSEIVELTNRSEQLDREIQALQNLGYCEEELKDHVEKLHEYNEMKDTGQMILGRIAILQQTTSRELYSKYGLELED